MANTFKSVGTKNVGTTVTTVYTAPGATTTTTIGMSLSNTTSSVVTIDAILSKGTGGSGVGSTFDIFLIKGAPILPGSTLVIVGGDQKVVLEAANQLKVQSSGMASIDVVVSVLEIT